MFHGLDSPILELSFGTPHRVLDVGMTKPLLFQMELGGSPHGTWVVKVAKQRPSTVLIELASSELCAHFGIYTPEVAIARLSSDVAEYDNTAVGQAALLMHQQHRGEFAFCSRHLEGSVTATPGTLRYPRAGQDEQLLRLFLFDALLWHSDRTRLNPNALWLHRDLVAIDHGRAMHNLEGTDDAGLGPDFSQHQGQEAWPRHIAFSPLAKRLKKGQLPPELFTDFGARVQDLTDGVLAEISARWPAKLDTAGLRWEIIRFLKARRNIYSQVEAEALHALKNG
ncbi:MAG: HipA family kinase [Polyangiaceae bacterium]